MLEDEGANHVDDPSVVRVGDEWWKSYAQTHSQTSSGRDRSGHFRGRNKESAWEKKGMVLRPR